MVRIFFSPEELQLTGRDLASHFAYRTFDVLGDSVVSFVGMCWIEVADQVDLTALRRNERTFSQRMLHFIVEHFGATLETAILRQRLFASIVQQELVARGVGHVRRQGADLYVGESRLGTSVAALTPVSTLVHFGVHVNGSGGPVRALGLQDFQLDPRVLALSVMEAYRLESEALQEARCKVRAIP